MYTIEIHYGLWHLSVVIDTSFVKVLEQTVQQTVLWKKIDGAAFFYHFEKTNSQIIGAVAASPAAPLATPMH